MNDPGPAVEVGSGVLVGLSVGMEVLVGVYVGTLVLVDVRVGFVAVGDGLSKVLVAVGDGLRVGLSVGLRVAEGFKVGFSVGFRVGFRVGLIVGDAFSVGFVRALKNKLPVCFSETPKEDWDASAGCTFANSVIIRTKKVRKDVFFVMFMLTPMA